MQAQRCKGGTVSRDEVISAPNEETSRQRAGYKHVGELQHHEHDHRVSLSHARQQQYPCQQTRIVGDSAPLSSALHQLLQTLSRRCGLGRARLAVGRFSVPQEARFVIVYQIASYLLGLHASKSSSIRGYRTAMAARSAPCPHIIFHRSISCTLSSRPEVLSSLIDPGMRASMRLRRLGILVARKRFWSGMREKISRR